MDPSTSADQIAIGTVLFMNHAKKIFLEPWTVMRVHAHFAPSYVYCMEMASARKFSCEPKRRSPYHEDLRWRMVWQRKVQQLKLSKVAMNLCIDTSTVQRIVAKFDATGQVAKKKYSSQNKIVKLTKPVQLDILHLFISKPDMYAQCTQGGQGPELDPNPECSQCERQRPLRCVWD